MLNIKTALFAVGGLILTTSIYGQDQVKGIKMTELTLMPSVLVESNPTGTLNDFYSLAPESKLLPSNLDGYKISDGYSYTGSFAASALMGFKFGNKDKSGYRANPTLRIGLTYMAGYQLSASAYNDTRTVYDTLTSSKTGETFAVDSIHSESYSMDYISQQLRLDASLIYRTNPEARWSLYAGVGATVGMSLNSYTEISHYTYSYISPTENSNIAYYDQSQDYELESEKTINDNNIGFSAYVPLGLDFRISNNSPFWSQVHLFYEMRPSINMTSIPELRTLVSPAFQNGFGVKIQWM